MKALKELFEQLEKAEEYGKWAIDHMAEADYETVLMDIKYALDAIGRTKSSHATIQDNIDTASRALKSTF